MDKARQCSLCGSALDHEALGEVCVRCSLRRALESDSEDDERPPPATHRASAGAGEAPMFPARFGDYDLLEVIGRGGMGVVYRARQRSLDRIVAVKVLAFGALADADLQEQFRTEATAAASLRHPHIVAIHATGIHAGWPYLAMDYVDGPDLAKRVATSPAIPAGRAARYVRDVALAVHFAHEHGVLHRDLKPSNVLLDDQDQPRLTDFGLARRLVEQSQLTLSRPLVGSPGYLPPEQADGRLGKVSRRSDVYGLGAILYHLVTGHAPFVAATNLEMLHQVLNTDVTRPRTLIPGVSRDLETICLRCLEKDPARRYATADEVAQELDRFLAGRPILARPLRLPARGWRWFRRRPLVLGLAVFAVIAGWLGADAIRASRELRREQQDRAIDAALTAAWAGDPTGARDAIQRASRHGARPEWVEMLEGQVALHALHSDEAMAHFERAVSLAPREVGPRAMLVSGALWRGDAGRYAAALDQLEGMEPTTALDYFSLGMALIAGHPDTKRPVALLERAVQMRPSGISFLALALAEGFGSSDTGSWKLVQRAEDHVGSAELILGSEHPAIRVVRLNTANMALRLCPADEYSAALRRAQDAAAALSVTPDPIGHMQRAFFFQITGEEETSLAEWEHAARGARTSMFAAWYSAAMFGSGRSEQALRTLDELASADDPLSATARAYLLCDVGRCDDAQGVYLRELSRPRAGFNALVETIPLVLGDRGRTARDSAQLLQEPRVPTHQRALLACLAGSRDWAGLLDRAADSRVAQANLHHYVALSRLAEGDPDAAMQHFRASVATGVHFAHAYQWSRAFLRRMERDPSWPRWISSPPRSTGSG